MQRPTSGDFEALKRVGRDLVSHGRLMRECVRQTEEPNHLVVCTDSDFASCVCTRRKHIVEQTALRTPHAAADKHDAGSGQPQLWRG